MGEGEGEAVAGYDEIQDVRQFPSPCAAQPPSFAGQTWETAYPLTTLENNMPYNYREPNAQAFSDVRLRLDPENCYPMAIMTGITVVESPGSGGQTYEDGVCTNPGCTFQRSGTCSSTGGTPGSNPGPAGG